MLEIMRYLKIVRSRRPCRCVKGFESINRYVRYVCMCMRMYGQILRDRSSPSPSSRAVLCTGCIARRSKRERERERERKNENDR